MVLFLHHNMGDSKIRDRSFCYCMMTVQFQGIRCRYPIIFEPDGNNNISEDCLDYKCISCYIYNS